MAVLIITVFLVYRNRRQMRGFFLGRRLGGEEVVASFCNVRDQRIRFYTRGG